MTTFTAAPVDVLRQSRLAELERVITANIPAFMRCGKALAEIQEQKLYRPQYVSFEAYCQQRWHFTRQHAYHLINAAGINEELSTTGLQSVNERVARELAKLPTPELRSIVLSAATVTAVNHEPTAEHVRSTVTVLRGVLATGGHVDVGDGQSTPLAAAIEHETYERMQRQREHVREYAARVGNPAPVARLEMSGDVLGLYTPVRLERRQMYRVIVYPIK